MMFGQQPQTEKERNLLDRLVKAGLPETEIQFQGNDNRLIVRYDYWQQIPEHIYSQLTDIISEGDFEDDDCGTLYMYDVI